MCGILESYTLGVVRFGGDPPGHVHTGICRRIGNGLVPANFDTVPSCKAVVFYPSHVIWARNGADLGHHSYCLLLMLMLLLLLMHHHPFRHLLRKKKNIVSFLASARKWYIYLPCFLSRRLRRCFFFGSDWPHGWQVDEEEQDNGGDGCWWLCAISENANSCRDSMRCGEKYPEKWKKKKRRKKNDQPVVHAITFTSFWLSAGGGMKQSIQHGLCTLVMRTHSTVSNTLHLPSFYKPVFLIMNALFVYFNPPCLPNWGYVCEGKQSIYQTIPRSCAWRIMLASCILMSTYVCKIHRWCS